MEIGSQATRGAVSDPCDAFNRDCPGREVLNHLTSRWGLLILVGLQDGPLRFHELRTLIDGVSEKMLSQNLRVLVHDGLLSREVLPTVPPSVRYALTPLGADAADRLAALLRWVKDNTAAVLAARPAAEESAPAPALSARSGPTSRR
ncbi:helix-turn-helix domain-containing protein [Streptomyces sp. RFCAC02]|uniref:winged helix-turn-helix transcriptional regulator n=1 Tax=Streptomyces sp. RFCAC02 TaxID=2499143 RepID=UPI00101F32B2|nr:helix-turn-helix domain-containing protein [Streptomyces sp. RFCAC02]